MKYPFSKTNQQPRPTQKQKKKEKKTKKSTNARANNVRKFIWVVLILFLFSSGLAIVRSNVVATKLSNTNKQLVKLEKQLTQMRTSQQINVPTTDAFFKTFIKLYCEQFQDYEKQRQRKEELDQYLKGMGTMTDQIPRVDTEVTKIENYGYDRKGDDTVGKFWIEMRTKSDTPQTFHFFLYVPFRMIKGTYQLTGYPYQQSDQRHALFSGKVADVHESPTMVLQDQRAVEKIKKFVEQFLTEYQENNRENLHYLMKEVEGLPEGINVQINEFRVFHTEDAPVVELTLLLSYGETGVSFEENMQLELAKTSDGNYFIEQLIHY